MFAANREEAIAYLKDGYEDEMDMPKPLATTFTLWIISSTALLISSIVPPYEYYLLVGMFLLHLQIFV